MSDDAKTILLVEDEPLVAMAEKMILEKAGYRVVTAGTGEKAIVLCRSGDRIDLILMDIDLGPDIDGTEAAEVILNERDVPLVFLSSHTEPETVAKTEKITSYGYIVKNSGDTVLLASVKMAFRLYDANRTINVHQDRYTTLFETITQGVVHQAADGTIISANPAAERILGLTLDQLRGKTSMNPEWHMIREDGTEVPGHDHPSMITLRTGKTVGPVIRGVFHPDKQQHVWLRIIAIPLFEAGSATPSQVYATFEDITEERGLDQRYRDLADHLPGIVYTFSSTRGGLYWSGRVQQILGYDPAEIQADPFLWNRLIHPDDRAAVEAAITDVKPGRSDGITYRIQARDGSWVRLHDQSFRRTVHGAETIIDGFATDVTGRTPSEANLRDSQDLNRALFDQTLSAIYIADPTGKLIDVNQFACEQSGYSRDELLQMSVFDLNEEGPDLHIDSDTHLLDAWNRWEPGDQRLVEGRYMRKDGTVFPVLISTGAIRYGNQKAIAAAVIDITERKRAEEEVRRLAGDKERLLRELQHRIKNNINTITSLVSLQAQTEREPAVVAALEDTKSRLTSLGVLYDQLYRSGSTGSGSVKDYLTELVAGGVRLFPYGERVTVRTDIDECVCTAQQLSALGLIVNEVMTNAMKYAFLDHPDPRLTLHGSHRDGRCTITITDNGPGLPRSVADGSVSGFGMTIVHALAEQLCGTLRFESDAGTRVMLDFPVDA